MDINLHHFLVFIARKPKKLPTCQLLEPGPEVKTELEPNADGVGELASASGLNFGNTDQCEKSKEEQVQLVLPSSKLCRSYNLDDYGL